jgi:hypothetical protein
MAKILINVRANIAKYTEQICLFLYIRYYSSSVKEAMLLKMPTRRSTLLEHLGLQKKIHVISWNLSAPKSCAFIDGKNKYECVAAKALELSQLFLRNSNSISQLESLI